MEIAVMSLVHDAMAKTVSGSIALAAFSGFVDRKPIALLYSKVPGDLSGAGAERSFDSGMIYTVLVGSQQKDTRQQARGTSIPISCFNRIHLQNKVREMSREGTA